MSVLAAIAKIAGGMLMTPAVLLVFAGVVAVVPVIDGIAGFFRGDPQD